MALYWMASGVGYELTCTDVCDARDHALTAAGALGLCAIASERIAQQVAGPGVSTLWMRKCLGIDAA